MIKRVTLLLATCLLLSLAIPVLAIAQDTSAWSTDSSVNNLLCKGGYYGMATADDGSGGVIIVWAQTSHSGVDIYAQRLDRTGEKLWSDNGTAVCTSSGRRYFLFVTSDGSGGAIIAWSDFRTNYQADVYAQRVDSAGTPQWDADGAPIRIGNGSEYVRALASDGSGGAIIAWSGLGGVFVQRVDSTGEPKWGGGISISSDERGSSSGFAMVSDGSGGAIISWEGLGFVYVQRVDSAGTPKWEVDGMALYSTPTYQPRMALVSDGLEGAIVTWTGKHENGPGVYAQRLDNVGQPLWGTEGVLVRSGGLGPVMTSDGSGYALVAWTDEQNSSGEERGDIYAQRLNPDGTLAWEGDGLAICTAPKRQLCPAVVSDGSGGAIIAWQDGRDSEAADAADWLWTDEVNVRHNDDIYAQRVDSSGEVLWASNGVPVCNAPHLQTQPMMTGCGSGSAVLLWADYRDYPLEDMHTDFNVAFDWYGQRVNSSGVLGPGSGDPASGEGFPIWAWIAIAAGGVGILTAGLVVWHRMAGPKRVSSGAEQ
jgi:hypothetical protein